MATDTVVVFRKWRDCGTIIAPFPELPSDIQGWYCDAYERVGQHGGADYFGLIQHSTPASPDEYADLAEELIKIGYHLRPIKRASWRHHQRRREVARAFAQQDTT